MNTFWFFVVIALLLSNPSHSGSVYKCTQPNKPVIFTDGKCPAHTQETLVHQETEQEIQHRQLEEKIATIKRLIADNQPDTAKEFAVKNNLSETYKEQLALFVNQKKVEAQQQVAEERQQQAAEERQQQLLLQQQALALQRQQLLMQSQQQITNTTPTYGYGYRYLRPYHSHRNYAPLSTAGMNPPQSFSSQMNPPQSFPSQINPPQQTTPTSTGMFRK